MNRLNFFRAALASPIVILPTIVLLSDGFAGAIALAALTLGGIGYLIWTSLTLYLSTKWEWPHLKRWLLLAPLSYWCINLLVLLLLTGNGVPSLFIWAIGWLYVIPVAYVFVFSWFILWHLIDKNTSNREAEC